MLIRCKPHERLDASGDMIENNVNNYMLHYIR